MHWQLLALAKRVLKPQDKNLLGKTNRLFHHAPPCSSAPQQRTFFPPTFFTAPNPFIFLTSSIATHCLNVSFTFHILTCLSCHYLNMSTQQRAQRAPNIMFQHHDISNEILSLKLILCLHAMQSSPNPHLFLIKIISPRRNILCVDKNHISAAHQSLCR